MKVCWLPPDRLYRGPNSYRVLPDGRTALLFLSQGRVTQVDARRLPLVLQFRWHAICHKGRWYARARSRGGGKVYLHMLLCAGPVDHRNGDGLDNRGRNLRPATHSENAMNSRVHHRQRASEYRGVCRDPRRPRWFGSIQHRGVTYRSPRYDTEYEAARWYDQKARELFGEYAPQSGVDA